MNKLNRAMFEVVYLSDILNRLTDEDRGLVTDAVSESDVSFGNNDATLMSKKTFEKIVGDIWEKVGDTIPDNVFICIES